MRRILTILTVMALLVLAMAAPVGAGTAVPGHDPDMTDRTDQDGNGYTDAGVFVVGHYYSVYAYDGAGDYYWDLGDGRIYKTVDTIGDLDQATLTVCDYVINYRADFGNDPYMNTGWIQNLISCSGYDDNNQYNYFIVHEDDPKYTGTGIPIWTTWEYHVLTISGYGNLVGPRVHVG